MNRKIAIALIALLLAIAVCAVLWSMRTPKVATGPALPTFDYASDDSWAVSPEAPPPAVWESGWAIDVVLLDTGSALETSDNVAVEKRRNSAAGHLSDMATAFDAIGPVYAPFLRASNLDSDTASAFGHYLSTDNRGRAFAIATDKALPADVLSALEADALLRDRFAGVLFYGDSDTAPAFANGLAGKSVCSRRYSAGAGCSETVDLRRSGGNYAMTGGGRLINGFTTWLNDHASKLAEPLGDLEEVEVIDIRRPGETGEASEN